MLVIESALEKLEACLVLLSFSLLLPAGIPQACKSSLFSHLLTYPSVVPPAAPGSAGSSAPAEQFLFLTANPPTILRKSNLGKI